MHRTPRTQASIFADMAEVHSVVFHPTIGIFHNLCFKYTLMLFNDIEEKALCVLHVSCNFLSYVRFNEIICKISKSGLAPSIWMYPLSYRWVMSGTLEEGTRVFNLHLSNRKGYHFLKGRIILIIICQELLDWAATKSSKVCCCSGSGCFSLNTSQALRRRMNAAHSHS